MKLALSAALIFLVTGTPALAHRLDEYLQGTIISVRKGRVDAHLTLTPGVAVFPTLVAEIDVDGNGIISEIEQHAYARRVLRDLSLKIDGQLLTPQLVSMRFPVIEEMKVGRGEIQIEFVADLPPGGGHRRLTFENHHQRRIAAYQVNCLASRDSDIRLLAQNRNYSQSLYELDFLEGAVPSNSPNLAWLLAAQGPLGKVALLLLASLTLLWRKQVRPAIGVGAATLNVGKVKEAASAVSLVYRLRQCVNRKSGMGSGPLSDRNIRAGDSFHHRRDLL